MCKIALLASLLTTFSVVFKSQAFTIGQTTKRQPTRLFNTDQEKLLRKELAERASVVENEEQYSLADGEFLENIDDAEVATAVAPPPMFAIESSDDDSTASKKTGTLAAKMERMTKPRAYPLFLAEKAAEIAESTFKGLTKTMGLSSSSPSSGSSLKEKVVILGTGWGAASYLKEIDTDLYDVTVISPRKYFLFTPMLAGASVGTVEYRSITEPIREINRKASYMEATATDIDPKTNTVSCQSVVCDGNSCEIEEFKVNYDRLIVTVGAQTNTFGIKVSFAF
jgi:hypothetical protein